MAPAPPDPGGDQRRVSADRRPWLLLQPVLGGAVGGCEGCRLVVEGQAGGEGFGMVPLLVNCP